MSFNCTGCGACCNRMASVVELVKDIYELKFPYSLTETGKCEMLDENNKCKVYDNRPTVCNIKKMQQYLEIPMEEFYELNKKACNKMILEDQLDEKYLIKN